MDQLTLDVHLRDHAGFDNYVPGRNALAVAAVEAHARERSDPVLWLRGPEAVGKSHLLLAACNAVVAAGEKAVYLNARKVHELAPADLLCWGDAQLVALDDIEAIVALPEWEAALFALFNRMRDAAGVMIVASRSSPREVGIRLPDLRSRLSSGPVYHLQRLTDNERLAALIAHAEGRGFELPIETGRYLMVRFPRDLYSLLSVLDRLDDASLRAQRRLTVPFVRQVLSDSENIED